MMSEWCWKELLFSESAVWSDGPCHMPWGEGGGEQDSLWQVHYQTINVKQEKPINDIQMQAGTTARPLVKAPSSYQTLVFFINNVKVPRVGEVVHLVQCLNEDTYKFSANKFVQDFNWQCNMFFLLTLNMPIYMLKMFFFHIYCTAFYGSQILPLFNNCMDVIYTAWRIAMHKI